jgi:hypothetical protein
MNEPYELLAQTVGDEILVILIDSGLDPSECAALLFRLCQHMISECADPKEVEGIKELLAAQMLQGDSYGN